MQFPYTMTICLLPKQNSALTRKSAKTFVQQKTLNAEKVYDCL